MMNESPQGEWPRLNPTALHGIIGEYWKVVSPHTESDSAAILFQTLTAFGNLVGRNPYFVAERSHHYLNLFMTLIGLTAKGRKGSSWSQVTALAEQLDGAWLQNRIMSGLSSGEGLIHAVRDPIPGKPGGKTGASDAGVDDKRILVVEAEFASVLRLVEREGNNLSAVLRLAWDTGALQTMTKNSPSKATSAHVSIIGHITRDELVRRLSLTEIANGFANRFLWICARRSKCLPDGGNLNVGDLETIVEKMRRAVKGARQTGQMQRDSGARDLWHAVYPDLSEGGFGMLGAVTSRGEAQVMRLACIYALLDHSKLVRREHLEAALAAWEYTFNSCKYVFRDAMGDPTADTIMRALNETPGGITRTDISSLFSRHRDTSEISRALNLLAERGIARVTMKETGGRAREIWVSGTLPAN